MAIFYMPGSRKKGEDMNGEKTKKILKKTAVILFWLGVWQLLSMAIHNPFLAASPAETFRTLFSEMGELSFWRTTLASLVRISAGFFLGMTAGILTAAVNHRFPLLEEVVSPAISLAKTVPVVSFVVLLLIWQGPAFLSVAVSFLIVFPGVYFSALEGLRAVDPKMLEMAKIFRLPGKTVFFYIYRPALRPFFLGSIKSSLGMAWKSGVAAEVIGLPAYSIGERIYLSKIYLDTAGILAWTAVTVCMSLLFEKAVLKLADLFFERDVECPAPAGPERSTPERDKDPDAQTSHDGTTPDTGENTFTKQACVLTAEKLEKSYSGGRFLESGQVLFSDLSLELSEGTALWLTWPSGEGKTTLLRILAGLENPDRGEVRYGRGRLFLSMLFQEDRLCGEYSVLRNVSMTAGDRGRAEEILRDLLDPSLFQKKCSLLSGGEKRRAALARALAAESDLLFLDEPFAGLDEETAERAWGAIRKWQGSRALLIASHILPGGREIPKGQEIAKDRKDSVF